MTRKDYPMLAEALRRAKPSGTCTVDELQGWRGAVNAVAEALAADNRAFDQERFMRNVDSESGT